MTPWATSAGRLPHLKWAAAFRPLSGESVSGDHHLVAPFEGGLLLAVVDALGHGEEAEVAARLAVATLSARRDLPIEDLLKVCHKSLSKTRGVAAALASLNLNRGAMTWIAIGNVEGVLTHADARVKRQSIIQHGGIVGYQLPRIPPVESITLAPRDRICFATDGIRSGFPEALKPSVPLADMAAVVLEKFENVRDDALVLIAEFDGADT